MATKKVNYKDEYVYQEGQTFPLVEDELKYNAETDSLDVVGKIKTLKHSIKSSLSKTI